MESAKAEYDEELLARAEELIKEMQRGNEQNASMLLDYVHAARENLLFQEVGKMTRQLHNALESFRRDSRIESLAEQEIPDARQRLSYVIEMTQKSADRTLNAVEETMPIAEKITKQAGKLNQAWKRFRNRELSVEQFRELSGLIETFLTEIEHDSAVMKDSLNDVLMAQDFQDLTGQIIKRVITLVEEVEGNLVELIRLTGDRFVKAVENQETDIVAEGPHVPGSNDSKDVVTNQDEVDDLLSSLGF
jgi:chemotaxis protein CheZ